MAGQHIRSERRVLESQHGNYKMAEGFEFINGDVHLSGMNCAAFGKFSRSLSKLQSSREGERNFSWSAVSAGCLSCMKKASTEKWLLELSILPRMLNG